MDTEKIKKHAAEIDQYLHHISEGNEYWVNLIRTATKAIRDQMPKPTSKGEGIPWKKIN